jgi:hypothetical protein
MMTIDDFRDRQEELAKQDTVCIITARILSIKIGSYSGEVVGCTLSETGLRCHAMDFDVNPCARLPYYHKGMIRNFAIYNHEIVGWSDLDDERKGVPLMYSRGFRGKKTPSKLEYTLRSAELVSYWEAQMIAYPDDESARRYWIKQLKVLGEVPA